MARKKDSELWEAHRKELKIDNRYKNIIDGALAKDLGKHKRKKGRNLL